MNWTKTVVQPTIPEIRQKLQFSIRIAYQSGELGCEQGLNSVCLTGWGASTGQGSTPQFKGWFFRPRPSTPHPGHSRAGCVQSCGPVTHSRNTTQTGQRGNESCLAATDNEYTSFTSRHFNVIILSCHRSNLNHRVAEQTRQTATPGHQAQVRQKSLFC